MRSHEIHFMFLFYLWNEAGACCDEDQHSFHSHLGRMISWQLMLNMCHSHIAKITELRFQRHLEHWIFLWILRLLKFDEIPQTYFQSVIIFLYWLWMQRSHRLYSSPCAYLMFMQINHCLISKMFLSFFIYVWIGKTLHDLCQILY